MCLPLLSDIVSLILLAGFPDTMGTAVIESLKFLSKLLLLAQKGEETPHLAGLVAQVDSLGSVEQAKVTARLFPRLCSRLGHSCVSSTAVGRLVEKAGTGVLQ